MPTHTAVQLTIMPESCYTEIIEISIVVSGHPLKAGHLFVCHSERSEESLLSNKRFARGNDKKRIHGPALSGCPGQQHAAVMVKYMRSVSRMSKVTSQHAKAYMTNRTASFQRFDFRAAHFLGGGIDTKKLEVNTFEGVMTT